MSPEFDRVRSSADLAGILIIQRDRLASRAGELRGIELMAAYSDLTDALVSRVLEVAVEEASQQHTGARRKAGRGLSIVAVGGYGRREMSPFSDVDVAFITTGEEDDEIDLIVKKAFRLLMDVLDHARLKVGYSYRSINDVRNLELDTQTALLDARCVAGSKTVYSAFVNELQKAIVPIAFVTGHINARRESGANRETPFVVEPELKEGCGGLRDLHAARWIGQIAFGLSLENVWEGLRSLGIVLDGELTEINAAAEFISRVRNTLHLAAGRGLDTLVVERHEQIASKLGFAKTRDFMSQYHRHAHELWRIYRKVARACLKQELGIEAGLVSRDKNLCILDKGLPARDGAAILRIFLHSQMYGLEIDREASDLIREAAISYKPDSEGSLVFLDILSRGGAAAALRSMADMDVLQAIVPGFGELMYLIPGDAAHQFTVGEHSLRTVEQLELLLSDNSELFAEISSRLQNFEVLFLAALLHDIGKLDSRRDHVKTGAVRAAKFASMLGMSEEDVQRVEFLVRHHLKMGETARLRDMNRQRTIRDFVGVVNDHQLLDMLFLLTIADNRAVGTRNWSQVQVRFLSELHERAGAAIRSPESGNFDIDRHRNRVKRELCLANLPPQEVEEHIASMPASYLLNTPPEDLAAHIGFVSSVREGLPVVDMKDERAGEFTILTVAAMDKTGLLSEIAGVLHALNVDIHAAQIFTRHSSDHIAIDILYIDCEGRQLTEIKKRHLEGELLSVLRDEVEIVDLLKRWNKNDVKPRAELIVNTIDNMSETETVLEIRTVDSPGFLYYLTHRFTELGWNIHSARVATWGHEARDVFYVTDSAGKKLNEKTISNSSLLMSICGF